VEPGGPISSEPAAEALQMREVQAGGALADGRLLGQEGEECGERSLVRSIRRKPGLFRADL
jgi:hypothetical protein